MDNEIKDNMLRKRAKKLPVITDEMYAQCLEHNRELVEEFFEYNALLSPHTRTQYRSGMRQFLWYVKTKLRNKPLYKITKKDFSRYMNYLINHGLSSSAIKFKRSSVSTLCEYIEDMVAEDDDNYESFRNFTKSKLKVPKNQVYNKVAITEDEYKLLIDTLLEKKDYMGCAWVACAFNSGARRGGIRQFKSEIVNQPIKEGQKFIVTNVVREKGEGVDGNKTSYMLPIPVLKYIKLWLDNRGYEHEYIFTTKYNSTYNQISLDWATNFCRTVLSPILKRRVNPHLFKSSAVSNYLSKGLDLKFVSTKIAKHRDISTTLKFYDLRNFEEQSNEEFAKLDCFKDED